MGMVQKNLPKSRLALVTDNYDDSEEEEEEEEENKAALISSQEQQSIDTAATIQDISLLKSTSSLTGQDDKALNEVDIKQLYPGFERNKILKFSELFMAKIKRPPKLVPHKRGKMKQNEIIYECY
jgi:transcription initiation factor TFIID subunit 1